MTALVDVQALVPMDDGYREEADRRLSPAQRERRSALALSRRTGAEEQEWRTLCYAPDVGDRRRAFAIAARSADAPYAINFDCNQTLNDEEKRTDEKDLLTPCRRLEVPVHVVHGSRDPRPIWAVQPLVERSSGAARAG